MTVTFALLLNSAVRASVLGVLVWAGLRLMRVRDANAETTIWTLVLIASALMPFLCLMAPAAFAVPFPALNFTPPSPPVLNIALISTAPDNAPPPAAPIWDWLQAHGVTILWGLYAAIVALNLSRLATGLVLTWKLYRAASPIAAPWAAGRAICTSAAITGPISFGFCILLPADYREWPETKLRAVLAHEQSHIRRCDFFIQLFAALHRALFWFSPFAWWLQARLCQLAEAASDEAAIHQIQDRTSYAEILIEVSRCAHGFPSQIAMAKGPNILWRVDRILIEPPERRLSLVTRLIAGGAILPAAFLVAGAHAAVPRALPATLPMLIGQSVSAIPIAVAADQTRPVTKRNFPTARPHRPAAAATRTAIQSAAPQDEVSYNPRALLDDPAAAIIPAIVPTGAKDKKEGSSDAAIILNLNE